MDYNLWKRIGIVKQKRQVLLGTALLFIFVSLFFFVRFLITPNTGLIDNYPEVVHYEGRLIFSPKALFSHAVASGMVPGKDEILKINGSETGNTRRFLNALYKIQDFKPYSVTLKREDGRVEKLFISPALNVKRLDWLFIFLFSGILIFTALSLIYKFPENNGYLLMAAASLVYLLFVCVKPFFYESLLSISLIHIGTFAPWMLFFFSLYYPAPKGSSLSRRGIIAGVLLYYLIFTVIRLIFFIQWQASLEESFFQLFRNAGRINNLMNGVAYLLFTVLIFHSYRKQGLKRDKIHLKWLLIGFVLAVAAYVFFEEVWFFFEVLPGEKISSGNISLVFLSLIPISFLIGMKKSCSLILNEKKVKVGARLILFVLFFYLFSISYTPLKGYYMGNNGLPDENAAFIAAITLLVVLFFFYSLLERLVDFFLVRHKAAGINDYVKILESENAKLCCLNNELTVKKYSHIQKEKVEELKLFLFRISGRIGDFLKSFREGIHYFELGLAEDPEQGASGEDLYEALDFFKKGFLDLKDFKEAIEAGFSRVSGIETRLQVSFLIKTAVSLAGERYDEAVIYPEIIDDPYLVCYPEEIVFILSNLLFNACEAGDHRRVRIKSTFSGGQWLCDITDTNDGAGLTRKEKIFEPCFTTKQNHIGLGLYLSRLYAEKNGGRLEYFREKGVTSFRLTLVVTE